MTERVITLCLYHTGGAGVEAAPLKDVLDAAASTTKSGALAFWYALPARSTSKRWRRLRPRPDEVENAMRRGEFASISFSELPQNEWSKESPGALLSTDGARESAEGTVAPWLTYMIIPESRARDQETLIKTWTRMWHLVHGVYGFIHCAPDHNDALAHATGIGSISMEAALEDDIPKRLLRIERYQELRSVIGEVVCFAYWGNFLGQRLVDRLGGPDAAVRDLPSARIEHLPGGGIYCQVPSPLTDVNEAAVVEFEEFFRRKGILT